SDGEVVDQGVEPDVDDLRRVARDRHPPFRGAAGAGDADVAQAGGDELEHLVAAEVRLQKPWVLLDVSAQTLAVTGEGKEVVLLADALDRAAAGRAEAHDLAIRAGCGADLILGKIGLIREAVPAFVAALVDVATLADDVKEVLHRFEVARL